jgi:hypothetical protein
MYETHNSDKGQYVIFRSLTVLNGLGDKVSTVAKVTKGKYGCEEHGIEKGFSVYIHVSNSS